MPNQLGFGCSAVLGGCTHVVYFHSGCSSIKLKAYIGIGNVHFVDIEVDI